MGAGRVGARRHDGEVHPIVALVEDLTPELGGHGGLGSPHQLDLAGLQARRDAVDGGTGGAQAGHFVVGLDRPDRGGDRGGPPESGRRHGRLEIDQESGPGVVADHGPLDRAAEVGHPADRIVALLPRHHLEHVGPLDHPWGLQGGHHQRHIAVPGHHQHGEPFQRHGLVAAEVGQVRAHRQQHRVDALGGHGGAGAGEAIGEHQATSVAARRDDSATGTAASAASAASRAW